MLPPVIAAPWQRGLIHAPRRGAPRWHRFRQIRFAAPAIRSKGRESLHPGMAIGREAEIRQASSCFIPQALDASRNRNAPGCRRRFLTLPALAGRNFNVVFREKVL